MDPKAHHKEIARFLKDKLPTLPKVFSFKDNYGKREVLVFESKILDKTFYSTIGLCDNKYSIPEGRFEFASIGKQSWIPNAIVSSVYWLEQRSFDNWPLICEDTIQINAKSTYRHMGFIPSDFKVKLESNSFEIRWLLGIPLRDSELSIELSDLSSKVKNIFPSWFFEQGVT